MNSKAVITLTASAVALLVTACGGGGGGGDSAATPPANATLQVAGTAATGAALTGASVEVKCAAGTATATTGTAGGYSVTITDGALPCLVEVKGTVNGASVSLHSTVESGTVDDSQRRTTAIANVTPVTEMIVAQLLGKLPDDAFQAFQGDALTKDQVAAAASAILAALKTAGVDFTGVDTLKGSLVPATSGRAGNAYDQLLDTLGAKMDRDALKVIVNQIAVAAQAKSEDGLENAMEAVSGGSLAGCPVAVSGRYRTVDQFGLVATRTLNFRTMTLGTAGSTTDSVSLTADPTNACVFTGTGTLGGQATDVAVAISAEGIGSFRAVKAGTNTAGQIGYIFPLQSHSYSNLRGTWSVLESRVSLTPVHIPGQVTLADDKSVTSCEYDSTWNCVPDTVAQVATERSDGGIDVNVSGQPVATLYGYRAPSGALVGIGSTNPTGTNPNTPQDVIVAAKLEKLAVPAVGTKTKSVDTSLTIANSVITSAGATPTGYTVQTSDATTSTVTRKRDSDGRLETLHFNQPITGVRTRDAGTFTTGNFAKIIQVPLTGVGLVVSVNADPAGTNTSFIYNLSVVTP